jgi:hypothetical protein
MKPTLAFGASMAVLAAALALSGCDRLKAGYEAFRAPPESAGAPSGNAPASPDADSGGPLTASGEGVALAPETSDFLQSSASVVRVDDLADQGVLSAKMYGTAGGDPAMNGLYTYIAFFESPAEGWRIFRIGDYLDYEILAVSEGRVDLKLTESVMEQSTGTIGSRETAVIVTFGGGENGAPPAAVTVTPAR